MPGYIIHLTEAEMILTALQQKGCFPDEDFRESFLLGALLPDTKRKREKVSSHFWREENLVNLAIPPDLKTFEKKYAGKIHGPLMLGYWAHLHLDEVFVNEFWPTIVTFLGDDGEEKVLAREITRAFLVHQKQEIPIDKFFSSEYYYGDYDRTNHSFYQKFHLHIPRWKEGPKWRENLYCPVTEVNLLDLSEVLSELEEMLQRDRTGDETLQVFEEEALIAFLKRTAECAADRIGGELNYE